jgi:hypothetical protein
MPTNPLWLEHTERAAWDTVQTLRQQIETERARVEQLLRAKASFPKMLEVVERVRGVHGISSDEPVTVVEHISAELLRLKQEHAELVERFRVERMQQERERFMAVLDSPRQSSADGASLSDFVERLRQYAASAASKANRSYERLLDALESKLEELEQAPRRERYEHAVALAYLASRVALGSRRDPDA